MKEEEEEERCGGVRKQKVAAKAISGERVS